MPRGYTEKLLRVDLSRGTCEAESLPKDLASAFIGGRGLGAALFAREAPLSAPPLAPETPLMFVTGPYTGTGVFSAFYNVTTRSPLTNLLASAHSGGTFGPSLKRAGFDAVVVTGRSDTPCYLAIEGGSCRIEDARALWGKGVRETDAALGARHEKAAVAAIGPAGEHLVRYASIMNNVHRAAGRGGVGAVMGAKNLKAVVAGGSLRPAPFDPEALAAISRECGKKALDTAKAFAKYGTSLVVSLMNEKGCLPTRNFTAGRFGGAASLDGDAFKSRYFVRDHGCFNCPLRCANIHTVPEGPFAVPETEGPEYETIMAFGSNCGNADTASIVKANDLCNDLGMDTISSGCSIAWAMDCAGRGLLPEDLLGGRDLSWGNAGAIVALLPEIAHRRPGLPNLLAEGSFEAGRRIGEEAARRAIHARGQEFPGYEVRRAHGTGLSFATSNRGGDHLRGGMYVNEIFKGDLPATGFSEEKVGTLVAKENLYALIDSFCMCKFGQRNGGFEPEVLARTLSALTGEPWSAEGLLQAGERTWALERLVNARLGAVPDALPPRLFEEDVDDGAGGGKRLDAADFAQALTLYNRMRGYDASGLPTGETVACLGLGKAATHLLTP